MKWYRGNLHTHTTASDGNVPVEKAAEWFHTHGYDFMVQTDHNFFREEPIYYHPDTPFLIIPGCELSMSAEDKPVHLGSINITRNPNSEPMPTIIQTIQAGIDRTRSAGGIAVINHPNWCWSFTEYHMSKCTDWCLFELMNASSDCNNWGAGGELSMEQRWDIMLSQGMKVYGVAADDSHQYTGEFFGWKTSHPAQAWVCVQADDLTAEAVVEALEAGRFYSSIECGLEEYEATDEMISLKIRQDDSYRYTTTFIGSNGRVLSEVFGTEASYRFTGNEVYVRARIDSSNGGSAWTMPVFL
jgi:hypothetical protein